MHENTQRVLLFDIDGTLMDSANEGRVCFQRALEDVCGATGPIETYDMAGKTDWQIAIDLLGAAGVEPRIIEASLPDVFAAYARHVEISSPVFKMRALPGVPALLAQLSDDPRFMLGLVTGNVREAVPHKLRAVGIEPRMFTFGAFGSEHIDRNQLPALALHRLGQQQGSPVPTESTLVIGDTPRDIACARHTGLKVLCIATGTFSRDELEPHNPDFLLDDLSDTGAVMEIFRSF